VEAIEEWEDAVHLTRVDVETVDDRREAKEREFRIDLPAIGRLDIGDEETTEERSGRAMQRLRGEEGSGMKERRNRGERAERMQSIVIEFEQTPNDVEGVDPVSGVDVPVQVDRQTSDLLDEDEVTSMEQALEVHHIEEVHDEVHAVIARLVGSDPESHYDSSKPSDLPGYDLVNSFDMTRGGPNSPWTNRRFDPTELFEQLEPFDNNRIQVLSSVAPLS
jgi:hypothetical protein